MFVKNTFKIDYFQNTGVTFRSMLDCHCCELLIIVSSLMYHFVVLVSKGHELTITKVTDGSKYL